ncbi:DUF4334 domain-containing protein [Rhizobium tubonense]|uniref:GXWXG protein n=1 Tax=Rhizobium tubonense TaxID=484088 RepID=A0A2W4F3D9_9HYPH|nr:DUF4334 domain-containing protein [Rhizobium tubonense]PZM16463.1 hypothetical protein CPY51_03780 [Rhizobium tubonense]
MPNRGGERGSAGKRKRRLSEQQKTLEQFQCLPPIEPREMIGLWRSRGIPAGHPFDGVLENLGWFGKRFTAELRADALLFRSGQHELIPIDPARIPLGLALRFHKVGRTRAARNLFSYLRRGLRAKGPVASLKTMSFRGVTSAAMAYDEQPIVDHFRRIDERRIMGMMEIEGDERIYFFELERVDPPSASA